MNAGMKIGLALGGGAVLAAAGTTAALMGHDKTVVDKLETKAERDAAVDQFSGAVDTIGWVGLAAAWLVPASNPALAAVKLAGWGVLGGNFAAKEIVEGVVLNRVEDKGNKLNPFDNKMTVGPSGH